MQLPFFVFSSLFLLMPQQGSRPATKPSIPSSSPSQKKVEGGMTPNGATGSPRALYLAAKVLQYAGGFESWDKVSSIVFTFAGRRRLFWDRKANLARIEFPSKKGAKEPPILFYDLNKDKGWVLGREDPRMAKAAKGIFINDFYWLTIPFKVLDHGVRLAILPREKGDPVGVKRLHLRFAKVGLTPQNQYILHVQEKTGRILSWDYFGKPGANPLSWSFEGEVSTGGLRLSLKRKNLRRGPSLEFTQLEVNAARPEGFLTKRSRIL